MYIYIQYFFERREHIFMFCYDFCGNLFSSRLVSPLIFYGDNPATHKKYTFRDTNGVEHIVSSFEDAKTILLKMYLNILKSMRIKIDPIQLEKSIKQSPNGNYAYLSLKLR